MIELLSAKFTIDGDGNRYWACKIRVTDGDETAYEIYRHLPPMPVGDLSSYLADKEAEYLEDVQTQGRSLLTEAPMRELIIAILLLILDQLNILRAQHELPEISRRQAILAIKQKLEEINA